MTIYIRGSKGSEVKKMQARLKELGYYNGPIDGSFGGGTESAVKSFQKAKGFTGDGKVGPKTWGLLFPGEEIPAPAIADKTLVYRCLALSGSFETTSPVPECFAGLSGDFDGMGISFGALQWNFGQGSLQPLLQEMDKNHPDVLQEIFDNHYSEFQALLKETKEEQVRWAKSIQDKKFRLVEPWRGLFKTLGRTQEYQDIQSKAAEKLFESAVKLCKEFGVSSERAVALMFDIKVQNGSINSTVQSQIERDFKKLQLTGDAMKDEVARLRIIANCRAEAANSRWIEDVRTRKLTIANGEGKVHGNHYILETQYGIRLQKFVDA